MASTKTVMLEGFLGEKYGRNWNIVADTYADIFSCIDANYPTFKKDLMDIYLAGGDISVQVGSNFIEEAEEFLHPVTKDTIIIVPLATGSSSGTGKILAAIAIVAIMFIPGVNMIAWGTAATIAGPGVAAAAATATTLTWAGTIAAGLALNLAITGLQQLMAPDPSVDQNDTNYLFNGPENTVVAGNPVPVLCGEMMVGGIVISSGVIGSTLSNDANYIVNGYYEFDAYGVGNGTSLSASDLTLLTNEGLIFRGTGVIG